MIKIFCYSYEYELNFYSFINLVIFDFIKLDFVLSERIHESIFLISVNKDNENGLDNNFTNFFVNGFEISSKYYYFWLLKRYL